MRTVAKTLAVLTVALVVTTPAKAQLIGTTVTGTLTFPAATPPGNYFDKALGFVPPGYLNSGPGGTPTVVISGASIEYGFQDSINLITADFTGSTLVVSDVSSAGVGSFVMTFTNTAFSGLGLSKIGDNFPPGGAITAFQTGNTITINYAGTGTPGTYQATFLFTAVPEPGQFAMAGVASLFAMGAWIRRRRAA